MAQIDLDALWADFHGSIGEDRGDEHRLHGSDLGGCDYATYLRLRGTPSLPFDGPTIERFLMGHMVEGFFFEALGAIPDARQGEVIEHLGLVGHIDYDVPSARCIIDVSTTRGKTAEPKYGHALKSAFYADAKGYEDFCEWVFRIDYKGNVQKPVAYWFKVADFASAIADRVDALRAVEAGEQPPMEPPTQYEFDPASGTFYATAATEKWRCRAYCEALCPKNQKADANVLADLSEAL